MGRAVADQVKAFRRGNKGQIGATRMGAAFGAGRNMQKPPRGHIMGQPRRKVAHRGQRLQAGGCARLKWFRR